MKLTILLLFGFSLLFSKSYYSKVEPYEIHKVSSNVMGVVSKVDEGLLGKKLYSNSYIVIDDALDQDELLAVNEKLKYLHKTLDINEDILKNLKESVEKKRVNYEKVKNLKIKSSVEKDNEFYNLINSENSYLSTIKEINNLKVQMADLNLRKAQLQRSIRDKHLQADGLTLYELNVKEGQVVNIGTPLATVVDTSKALLTIYLDADDLKNIKNKSIYIHGKKTSYKIDRVLYMADSKNISRYMAQIIIKAPKIFSGLVKVDIKKSDDAK